MNQWLMIATLGGLLFFTYRQDKVVDSNHFLWAWIAFALTPLLPLLAHFLFGNPRTIQLTSGFLLIQQIGLTVTLIQLARSLIRHEKSGE
ncbi:hypothetical protein V2O64_25690 (plasmid) [Verrucomicrobiaceae bacterium 227]